VLPVRFGSVYPDAAALEAQFLGPARTQLDALLKWADCLEHEAKWASAFTACSKVSGCRETDVSSCFFLADI